MLEEADLQRACAFLNVWLACQRTLEVVLAIADGLACRRTVLCGGYAVDGSLGCNLKAWLQSSLYT